MLPAVELSVVVKVKGTEVPGATGAERAIGVAPAKVAAVPLNTVVAPLVTTMSSLAQKSVAVPLRAPLFDWVQIDPGVNVKVLAGTVPMFLMFTVVTTDCPGTIVVLPPNLLIVVQVEELVDTVPPSVEVQVVVPAELVSCMTRTPEAAVLLLFVMLAANPADEPERVVSESAATASPETTVAGTNRRRADEPRPFCSDIILLLYAMIALLFGCALVTLSQ